MIKIDIAIGTRPEAIKMAPVVMALRARGDFSARVIATGQHTDMLAQALAFFGVETDIDLRIMRERQSLDYITSSVLTGVGEVLDASPPDALLVHGDTTTTMASALAAFYRRIPVGHVEAGLRSFDMGLPFPEEMNRVVTDAIASWWFAPTEGARANLLRGGADDGRIFVTGNTVIDALKMAAAKGLPPEDPAAAAFADGRRFILVTAHRRESWGEPMENICRAVLDVAEGADVYALVPMHKNPAVRETMRSILGASDRVMLCDPLGYADFVWALGHCEVILSDSGGVQEEASALAKPVVILRSVTERPEAVERGSGVLAGTERERIARVALELLTDAKAREAIRERCASAPFGDGRASERVADILARFLGGRQ